MNALDRVQINRRCHYSADQCSEDQAGSAFSICTAGPPCQYPPLCDVRLNRLAPLGYLSYFRCPTTEFEGAVPVGIELLAFPPNMGLTPVIFTCRQNVACLHRWSLFTVHCRVVFVRRCSPKTEGHPLPSTIAHPGLIAGS